MAPMDDRDAALTSLGPISLWAWDQIHHATARLFKPQTEEELAAILRAIASIPAHRRVTFRGGGQAMDAQAINDDIVVVLDSPEFRMIGEPQRDEAGYHVTIGAAARWGDIVAKTTEHGLLPYSVVTTSNATAGGTIAADCLSRCSPIAGREGSHVRSFRMITGDGRIVDCRRDDPDPERAELFRAAIGGFGYLGAITRATIDLRPPLPDWRPGRQIRVATRVDKTLMGNLVGGHWSELLPRLRERVCSEDEAECRDGLLDDLLRLGDDSSSTPMIAWDAVSSAGWYALDQIEALLFRSRYVLDREVDPMPLYQRANSLVETLARGMIEPAIAELGEGAMFLFYPGGVYVDELADFTFFMENQFAPAREAAKKDGWRLNSVQQTFLLPARRTEEDPEGVALAARFLDVVRPTLFDEPDAPSFLDAMRPTLIDVLYLPADDILLSAGRGSDGFAVTLSFARRDSEGWDVLRARLRELSKRCAELGGRVHLVKNVEADPDDLETMYGEAFDRFMALKQRCDPRGSIRNEFFDRIFRPEHRRPASAR